MNKEDIVRDNIDSTSRALVGVEGDDHSEITKDPVVSGREIELTGLVRYSFDILASDYTPRVAILGKQVIHAPDNSSNRPITIWMARSEAISLGRAIAATFPTKRRKPRRIVND